MSEFVSIVVTTLLAVALFVGLGMMAWYFILRQLRKETGPWVVTRVGVGGREFFHSFRWSAGIWKEVWSMAIGDALILAKEDTANRMATDLLADVHPLSRYVGGVR